MDQDNRLRQGQWVGGTIAVSILLAVAVVAHHPTSLAGPDDGLLMRDWSNTFVHRAMIVCLLIGLFAFPAMAWRLGTDSLRVQTGVLSFVLGMQALIGAALINGFVLEAVATSISDPAAREAAFQTLWAVNQALAGLGISLVGLAVTLWSISLLGRDAMTRLTGGIGIAVGLLALGWVVAGQGRFGLYQAMTATVAFALWALLVAVQMIRGRL